MLIELASLQVAVSPGLMVPAMAEVATKERIAADKIILFIFFKLLLS
jgi:hypothetical protein